MKARICVLALTLALTGAWSVSAPAQVGAVFVPDMASSANNGTPFLQRLHNSNFPGLFWFSFTGTDENVGFLGSYGTVGAKSRLGDSDVFGGRWLFEGRAHVSAKSGRFFTNLGLERVFTVAPANSDISFGVWWDWDNDRLPGSATTYQQVGFSAKLKTPNWDLTGNIYKPGGDNETLVGTPDEPFFGNNILLQNGFDIAMEGFDIELRLRPFALAMFMGTLDIGTYYHQTDVDFIDSFAGVRVRLGLHAANGCQFNVGLSHDGRFDTSVFAQVIVNSQIFGQYDPSGRDLEPTIRNDHIVRIHQDTIFLINAETGLPFRMVHVDNTAGAGGDGTFENPFNNLFDAENDSIADDIIFVHNRNTTVGDTTGLDTGIQLKLRQQFLAAGTTHVINSANVGQFVLSADFGGVTPTLTNISGAAISLHDQNIVRGFNINDALQGIQADGSNGFNGAGLVDKIIIDGTGAIVSSGILVQNVPAAVGGLTFTDLTINNTEGTAVRVANTTSLSFVYSGNITPNVVVSGPLLDISNHNNGGIIFQAGVLTDDNGEGIRIANSSGNVAINSVLTINDTNASDAINISVSTGAYTFAAATITDASGDVFDISGGSPTVTYNGSATKTTDDTNFLVNIAGVEGGTNIDFVNGTLTRTGASGNGVRVNGAFSGATVDFADLDLGLAGAGNQITNGFIVTGANGEATITVNQLDIFTDAAIGIGFDAAGDDTVIVNAGNINSNAGTALKVNLPSINNVMNFGSVIVTNGTRDGIDISGTGGNITITTANILTAGVNNEAIVLGNGNNDVDILGGTLQTTGATALEVNGSGGTVVIGTANATGVGAGDHGISIQNIALNSSVTVNGGVISLNNGAFGARLDMSAVANGGVYSINNLAISAVAVNQAVTGVTVTGGAGSTSGRVTINSIAVDLNILAAGPMGVGFNFNAGAGTLLNSGGNTTVNLIAPAVNFQDAGGVEWTGTITVDAVIQTP